jgi:hypothetical protein
LDRVNLDENSAYEEFFNRVYRYFKENNYFILHLHLEIFDDILD